MANVFQVVRGDWFPSQAQLSGSKTGCNVSRCKSCDSNRANARLTNTSITNSGYQKNLVECFSMTSEDALIFLFCLFISCVSEEFHFKSFYLIISATGEKTSRTSSDMKSLPLVLPNFLFSSIVTVQRYLKGIRNSIRNEQRTNQYRTSIIH